MINFKSYLFQDEAINPVPSAHENRPRHSEAETDTQQQRTPLHDGPIGSCLTAKKQGGTVALQSSKLRCFDDLRNK